MAGLYIQLCLHLKRTRYKIPCYCRWWCCLYVVVLIFLERFLWCGTNANIKREPNGTWKKQARPRRLTPTDSKKWAQRAPRAPALVSLIHISRFRFRGLNPAVPVRLARLVSKSWPKSWKTSTFPEANYLPCGTFVGYSRNTIARKKRNVNWMGGRNQQRMVRYRHPVITVTIQLNSTEILVIVYIFTCWFPIDAEPSDTDLCLKYIERYFADLVRSPKGRKSLLLLSREPLIRLLQSDRLHLRAEYELLLLAAAWANLQVEKNVDPASHDKDEVEVLKSSKSIENSAKSTSATTITEGSAPTESDKKPDEDLLDDDLGNVILVFFVLRVTRVLLVAYHNTRAYFVGTY